MNNISEILQATFHFFLNTQVVNNFLNYLIVKEICEINTVWVWTENLSTSFQHSSFGKAAKNREATCNTTTRPLNKQTNVFTRNIRSSYVSFVASACDLKPNTNFLCFLFTFLLWFWNLTKEEAMLLSHLFFKNWTAAKK